MAVPGRATADISRARVAPGQVATATCLSSPTCRDRRMRHTSDLQAGTPVADGWPPRSLAAPRARWNRAPKGVDSDRFRPRGPDQHALIWTAACRVTSLARADQESPAGWIDAVALVRARVANASADVGSDRGGCAPRSATGSGRCGPWSATSTQTPSFYRTGNLFALSSDFDNSPNVVLEAMASGLPVDDRRAASGRVRERRRRRSCGPAPQCRGIGGAERYLSRCSPDCRSAQRQAREGPSPPGRPAPSVF
jgi:hypothetical protein